MTVSSRHLLRQTALQVLFVIDMGGKKPALDELITWHLAEFAPGVADGEPFVRELVQGVLDHQGEIDPWIAKAAPEWPLEQITATDRTILRLALYEMRFGSQPYRVVINEAIELAKAFGGETSGSFVNGVLGAIYRRMEKEKLLDAGRDQKPPEKTAAQPAVTVTTHKLKKIVHDTSA